ncbi:RHS repeat domain-containing protein [Winogradskyella luteola]|uniref:4Fe-4S ferredoxin-type domain-containing protein n=1 Tax=Winogradskyella luteola TaxID=2828330 RepID=A0A9X1F870_9FLAO|nr:RHS repeat-associated core domain-containing protein [Winogradskyella luteola]MBV7269074.1 hypothetical protein [Winogradskyella luteola]
MKNKSIHVLITLWALFFQILKAQEQPPIPDGDTNWISSINYDFTGKTIGKSVGFFNTLGKATQSQSWDLLTDKVWNSQVLYDAQGRAVFQTLSAPHGYDFEYNPNFVMTTDFFGQNVPYNSSHFETDEDNPRTISATSSNTLGYYYSNNNSNNPYQDVTEYPFSRTVYSKLNPGKVKKVLGGNKVNGEWLQSYSFIMKAGEELSLASAFGSAAYRNWRVSKTVGRDAHGVETVVFSDSDGNTLAAARSGNEHTGVITDVKNNEVLIGEQGWVDIHISKGCTTSIRLFSSTTGGAGSGDGTIGGSGSGGADPNCNDLVLNDQIVDFADTAIQDCFNQKRVANYQSNPSNVSKSHEQKSKEVGTLLYAKDISTNPNLPEGIYYRIYDLIEEDVVMEVPPGTHTLPVEGFYRIELRYGVYVSLGALSVHYSFDVNERPGYFNLDSKYYKVDHCQNYYDYSLNYYDKAGRLIKSTQPNGKEFKSEFKYNSLGQLLTTTNIDEGDARFAYRKDGQIRFSQNSKQQSNEAFSYTNYDRLGRPTESGVYRGGDIYISGIILAADGTTPYDIAQGVSGSITPVYKQNITGLGYVSNADELSLWQSSLASNEALVDKGYLRFKSNYNNNMVPEITDNPNDPGSSITGGTILAGAEDTVTNEGETSTNLSSEENGSVTNGRGSVIHALGHKDFYNVIVGLVEGHKSPDFVAEDVFPMAYGINLVAKFNTTSGEVTYHTYIMEDGELLTTSSTDFLGNSTEIIRDFGSFSTHGEYSIHRTDTEIQYKLNGSTFYTTSIASSPTLVAKALFKHSGNGAPYILLDEIVAPPPANPNEGLVDENDRLNDTHCYEQHFTEYDIPDLELRDRLAKCGLPQKAYKQTFLSGNVSKTYTLKPQTNTTWYSYDVYGRVKWLVQMPHGMDCLKTIDYVYHPITGQVIEVDYQRHNIWERFIHRYTYNDAGQLTTVETSVDGNNFDHQATYIYNETGLLIRTELAENLQGIDYVYNLNGQLKAINHPSLSVSNDPGNDGNNGFMADVFGMSIQYYQGDYARLSTPTPITNIGATTPNQFNGNIQAIQWQNQNSGASTYSYAYNKNNWLQEAKFNSPSTSTGDYNVDNLTYDANGNIKTLNRNGYTDASGNNAMDAFNYHYKEQSNQLTTVEDRNDNQDPNRYGDLKSQAELEAVEGPFGTVQYQVTNENYTYNTIGQMVLNAQEGVGYEYNASGLVTKIKAFSGTDTNSYLTLAEEDYETVTCSNGYSSAKIWFRHLDGGTGLSARLSFADQADAKEDHNDEECTRFRILSNEEAPQPLVALPEYCTGFDTGNDSQYNTRHQINFYSHSANDTYSTATRFGVVPQAYHKLSLDILLLQEQTLRMVNTTGPDALQETQTEAINITNAFVEVIEYSSSGAETVLATASIAGNALFCNRIGGEVNMDFVPTKQKVKLRITVANDGGGSNLSPSTGYSKIFQTIEVDNIHLQVANEDKLAFFYDDRGHRIRKEAYTADGNVRTTFYVRDASGSPMAIYQKDGTDPLDAKEYPVYGTSRLGIMYNEPKYREKGVYAYQLTDHLGNVRAVVMKSGSNALSLTSKTDYYPFGMPMPNRNLEGNYRYGYQGEFAEKEHELGNGRNSFEARLWDARIGRWLTVDPAGEFFSPYLGMGNNPISTVDPDGACTSCSACPDRCKGLRIDKIPDGQAIWNGPDDMDVLQAAFDPSAVQLDDVSIGTQHIVTMEGYFGRTHFWMSPGDTMGDYHDRKQEARQRLHDLNWATINWMVTATTTASGATGMGTNQVVNRSYSYRGGLAPSGAFTVGGKPVYRGGNGFNVKPNEVKIDKATGDVKTTHGVSLDLDPNTVSKFGGAYRVHSLPKGLKVIQRGQRMNHYEIVPEKPMPLKDFQNLLNQIKVVPH